MKIPLTDVGWCERVTDNFIVVSYVMYTDGGECFEKGVHKETMKEWELGINKLPKGIKGLHCVCMHDESGGKRVVQGTTWNESICTSWWYNPWSGRCELVEFHKTSNWKGECKGDCKWGIRNSSFSVGRLRE